MCVCFLVLYCWLLSFVSACLSCLSVIKRLKVYIALHVKPISELRVVTCRMRSHSDTCHLTHVTPAGQAGTWFTYPKRMEGWVDIGIWLHNKMVYLTCLRTLSVWQSPIQVVTESNFETSTSLCMSVCLCFSKSFMLSTLGFTCVAFVAGALALWAPKYMSMSLLVTQVHSNDNS